MGGTRDKRPWSGKDPDEVRPESEVPTGQDPVHPAEPGRPSPGKDGAALRRREQDVPAESDYWGGYDEL
ncbi:hypothetical protein ABZ934_27335 [Streptomyces sp. NPDC046557]|uniref:hypothetical protein n=1 Tax=Streptomyces sp. NPDC046557 TaxID=3155372 RepID=UPI0033DEC299